MKTAVLVAAVAATFPVVQSISLNHKRDAAPRVLGLSIEKRAVADPVQASHRRFRKRASTVTETLTNEATYYYANLSLGTPAQSVRLAIDTGSSDLWTNVVNSTLCTEKNGEECAASKAFNVSASSTVAYVNSDFNITYADGSGAAGNYLTDKLVFGGKTIDTFQFGVGYESTNPTGVCGVGYSEDESFITSTTQTPYANLPLALAKAGLIETAAYSLYLNDLDASTGEILFGGVDTDKYSGTLESVAIIPEDGIYVDMQIALTGVSYSTTSGGSFTSVSSSSLPVAVVLDSGSTLSYLPDDVVADIYNAVGAEYDDSEGVALVECDIGTGAINFTFSSPVVSVSLSEMIIGEVETTSSGAVCEFGLAPSGDSGVFVLGDSFLRSAYVVYDIDNNEISLANTKFNSTSSNVVEIAAGTTGVPGASIVTNAVTSVAAETGSAVVGTATGDATLTVTGSVSTSTSAATSGAVPASSPLSGKSMFWYVAAGAVVVAAAAL